MQNASDKSCTHVPANVEQMTAIIHPRAVHPRQGYRCVTLVTLSRLQVGLLVDWDRAHLHCGPFKR